MTSLPTPRLSLIAAHCTAMIDGFLTGVCFSSASQEYNTLCDTTYRGSDNATSAASSITATKAGDV